MRKVFLIIVILFLGIIPKKVNATAQYGDLLITGKDTSWITSNPLEIYFKNKGERTLGDLELEGSCSALWRGYVATWKLESDSLFLVRVQTDYCGDNPKEIDLTTEFNTNHIYANWVNHTLVRTKGELLRYVHAGYASIYEEEIFYSFNNGILESTSKENYLVRDSTKIFPGENYLRDTIRSIILKTLDNKTRSQFKEKNSCSLYISFDTSGTINNISIGYGQAQEPKNLIEKAVIKNARIALKNFPKLMRVNHFSYRPPSINLFFNGHCLLHPEDREYGCKFE